MLRYPSLPFKTYFSRRNLSWKSHLCPSSSCVVPIFSYVFAVYLADCICNSDFISALFIRSIFAHRFTVLRNNTPACGLLFFFRSPMIRYLKKQTFDSYGFVYYNSRIFLYYTLKCRFTTLQTWPNFFTLFSQSLSNL